MNLTAFMLLGVLLLTRLGATAPPHPAAEAGADARAPWIAAPRPPDVSEDRYRQTLEELKVYRPRMLFIGDSITENWLTSGRTIWDTDFQPRGAANLGFGGDRTENTLWRISDGELRGIAPEVTILEIGTNDLDRWTVPEVAHGIVAVVAAIREHLPSTHIVLLGILPRDYTAAAPLRVKARQVNEILATTTFDSVTHYYDIGYALTDQNSLLLPGVMEDGHLHPSLDGYLRLAAALRRILPPGYR